MFEDRVNQVSNTLLNLPPKGVSLFQSRKTRVFDGARAPSVASRADSFLFPTPFTTHQILGASPKHLGVYICANSVSLVERD